MIPIRSNFDSRGVDSREIGRSFGHNSEPVRSSEIMLRHYLPIITPDLPIPTKDLN